MRDLLIIGTLVLGITLSGSVSVARAAEDGSRLGAFEKGASYDIYIQYGKEDISVVENVEIIDIEEIHGKKYLVITSKAFKLQGDEGFILWDAVVAVLPNDDFRFQRVEKIRYR